MDTSQTVTASSDFNHLTRSHAEARESVQKCARIIRDLRHTKLSTSGRVDSAGANGDDRATTSSNRGIRSKGDNVR